MFELIVPMSGSGERFRRAGFRLPKPMIPVVDLPMIGHVLSMFPSIHDPLLIVNREHLKDHSLGLEQTLRTLRPDCRIHPIDPHKRGPAWAIKQASHLIRTDLPCVVSYCDFGAVFDEQALLHELRHHDGLIATYSGFHPHMLRSTKFAYVAKNANGKVIDIREKDSFTDSPMSEEASCGIYGFRTGTHLLDAIDTQLTSDFSFNDEYYVSLTYKSMLPSADIETFPIHSFMQWGTPEDLFDFEHWCSFFRALNNAVVDVPESPAKVNATMLLASGQGRRFSDAGYRADKPTLALQGQAAWSAVAQSIGTVHSVLLVTREDQIWADNLVASDSQTNPKSLKLRGVTRGQADSALLALQQVSDGAGALVIAACDGLFAIPFLHHVSEDDPIAFLASHYRPALLKPHEFSWAKLDSNGSIVDVLLKQSPPDADWLTLTGTFAFPSVRDARESLAALISSGHLVNGEFYIDTCFHDLVRGGRSVKGVDTNPFVSIGTPEEYESFRYWQRAFDRWGGHPYKLSNDRLIPPLHRLAVISNLRCDHPQFWSQ